MKVTILRENLLKALTAASKVVPLKNTLPILSHVLIKAETGKISIVATNLESALSVSVPASVDEEGLAAVSLKILKDALSHISSPQVVLEYADDKLTLSSLKSTSAFMCLPASDFPSVPEATTPQDFLEINGTDFLNAVSQVVFAAATDEARPIYTGVKLFVRDGYLYLAATDGFRLSEKRLKLTSSTATELDVIVPAKTLLEIVRILSSSADPIRMYTNPAKNLLFLENDEAYVATGVIDGAFPDYTRIIPTETSHSAELEVKDILEAAKLASVFTRDDGDKVKLVFDPSGFLHVTSAAKETGESTTKIEAVIQTDYVEGDSGGPLEVFFQPRYLLDIFALLKSDKIILKTASSSTPCLVMPTDSDTFIHIMMPVRPQS